MLEYFHSFLNYNLCSINDFLFHIVAIVDKRFWDVLKGEMFLNYEKGYFLDCSAVESQSIAGSSPSPFFADVLNICLEEGKLIRDFRRIIRGNFCLLGKCDF